MGSDSLILAGGKRRWREAEVGGVRARSGGRRQRREAVRGSVRRPMSWRTAGRRVIAGNDVHKRKPAEVPREY